MTPTRPIRRSLAAALVAGLALGAAACGDGGSSVAIEAPGGEVPGSGDPTLPGDGSPLPGGDPAGSTSLEESCTAFSALGRALAGGGDAGPALRDFATAAPIDIRAYAEELAAAVEERGVAALAEPDTAGSVGQVGNFFYDQCELAEQHQLTVDENGFNGLPDHLPAGRIGIELSNLTTKDSAHGLLLVRRAEGDERTGSDLAGLGIAELAEGGEAAGIVWVADADSTGATVIDVEEGRYLAICVFPGEGEAHDHPGSIAEIEVGA